MSREEIEEFMAITQTSEEVARRCINGRTLERALNLFFESPPDFLERNQLSTSTLHDDSSPHSDQSDSSILESSSDDILASSLLEEIFPSRMNSIRRFLHRRQEIERFQENLPEDEAEIELDQERENSLPNVLNLGQRFEKQNPEEKQFIRYPPHNLSFEFPVLDLWNNLGENDSS